jgi:hypothetical protein
MVRVLDDDGFSVRIWPNDHEPAHVHVYRAEAMARIEIVSLNVRGHDMRPKDLRRALSIVSANQELLLRKWREMHGK